MPALGVASIVDGALVRRRSSFFEKLDSVVQRASQSQARIRYLRLGSRLIRIRFADAVVERALVAALSHAECEQDAAESDGPVESVAEGMLDFAVWGGEAHPPSETAPWSQSDIGPRGAITGFNTERYRTAFNPDSLVMSAFDRRLKKGYFWIRSPSRLPLYERAAPLRTLFSWGLESWGWQMVHAAAVCGPKGAALLVGRGGSGKSSSALSCLSAGMRYLSDDYCALEMRGGRAFVHGVYRSGKLQPTHMDRFLPELRTVTDEILGNDGAKTVLLVQARHLAREAPVLVMVLPQVGGQHCTLEAASSGLALKALAPSSIFQGPALAHTSFQFLARLTRSVRCVQLQLGGSAKEIPEILQRYVGLAHP